MPANSSSSPSNVITHAEQCMPLTLNTCFAISISSCEFEVTAVHAHRAGVAEVPVSGACRDADSDLASFGQAPLEPDRGDYEAARTTGCAAGYNSHAYRFAGRSFDQVRGVPGVGGLDRDRSVRVRLGGRDILIVAAGLGDRHRGRVEEIGK